MGMSCITNLISFYDSVTHLADKGKPVDGVLFDYSEEFNPLLHSILLDKMSITQLEKSMLHWVSHWLMCQAPRGTVN